MDGHMPVCLCLQRSPEGIGSPGTGVPDNGQPCRCWELDRGPLEEWPVCSFVTCYGMFLNFYKVFCGTDTLVS